MIQYLQHFGREAANVAEHDRCLWGTWAMDGDQTHGHALLCALEPGKVWVMRSTRELTPVELTAVYVQGAFRKQGHATTMVSAALDYAKRKKWDVVLRCRPYGNGRKMATEDLQTFYGQFGFIYVSEDQMIWRFR